MRIKSMCISVICTDTRVGVHLHVCVSSYSTFNSVMTYDRAWGSNSAGRTRESRSALETQHRSTLNGTANGACFPGSVFPQGC